MNTKSDSPPSRSRSTAQPPCSDQGWPRRCGPLLAFLLTPRTWDELVGWASDRGIAGCRLRNMLAWLEDEGIAGTIVQRRELADVPIRAIWRRYDVALAVANAERDATIGLAAASSSISPP